MIKECLDTFCVALGQKVSLSKLQIFFSKNVCSKETNRIVIKASIRQYMDLGRYLGVPSIHSRTTNNLFTSMIERIDNMLDGWNSKLLPLLDARY